MKLLVLGSKIVGKVYRGVPLTTLATLGSAPMAFIADWTPA
jgi:hypothetical protein